MHQAETGAGLIVLGTLTVLGLLVVGCVWLVVIR